MVVAYGRGHALPLGMAGVAIRRDLRLALVHTPPRLHRHNVVACVARSACVGRGNCSRGGEGTCEWGSGFCGDLEDDRCGARAVVWACNQCKYIVGLEINTYLLVRGGERGRQCFVDTCQQAHAGLYEESGPKLDEHVRGGQVQETVHSQPWCCEGR